MNTEIIKISDIISNPENPRVIKDDKFKKLVQSIKDFPEMLELRPIVVNAGLMVLGGNMRLKAAHEAGLKEVAVIRAESLTEAQQKEFIIKDNLGYGEWDWELINANWDTEQLTNWGLDIPAFKLQDAQEDDYVVPDEIETDIIAGDLFEIGVHRLLCGDSTNADDVGKLLGGKEPYLMVTDPPYGVNYNAEWRKGALPKTNPGKTGGMHGKVSNDDKADWVAAWSLSPSNVAYVWHAGIKSNVVQDGLEKSNYDIRAQIIWNKHQSVIGRGHYHIKHEPCWYAVKKGSKGNWAGDRKQHSVWDIPKPLNNETGHSTQKPVECMARPIANHDGDVYDPFLGSGTTMVAAHQLNRRCYGMEIDPKYCQVIVDRMRKLDPAIVIKKNGETCQGVTI